jgi:hypothetical protein
MIKIFDGFTSISAGSDCIDAPTDEIAGNFPEIDAARSATGVRVTVEFRRESALAPGQVVTVRYDFAGDGSLREGQGIASPTHSVARWGRAVVHHYRMSHWIQPADVMDYMVGNVRYRTEECEITSQPLEQQAILLR